MKIAIAQICSTDDPQRNFKVCREVVRRAVRRGVEYVAFPECADIVFSPDYDKQKEREDPKNIQMFIDGMRQLAEESTEDDTRWFNSAVTFNDKGEEVHRYDKIHPCEVHLGDIMDVSETESVTNGLSTQPGLKTFDLPSRSTGITWKVGVMICYDVRYPQLATKLRTQGAEMIVLPTAWFPATKDHWDPLTTARAIENQLYLVAPDQAGPHDASRTSFGLSAVIDPWGRKVVQLPSIEEKGTRNSPASAANGQRDHANGVEDGDSKGDGEHEEPDTLSKLLGESEKSGSSDGREAEVEMLSEFGPWSCIGYAELRKERVAKLRKAVPVFEYNRPDVYGTCKES